MTAQQDYWKECIAQAACDCDLTISDDQLDCLASAAEIGHENYGMAFYSPPAGDGIRYEERTKEKMLQNELERTRAELHAHETALRNALRLRDGDGIAVERDGTVRRLY